MPLPQGISVGQIVTAIGEVQDNIGRRFCSGTEFRVCMLDDFPSSDDNDCVELTVYLDDSPEDMSGTWFYVDGFAERWGFINNKFEIKGE